MPRVHVAELVRGTQGALVGGRSTPSSPGCRSTAGHARAGDVFFAIRGPRLDGHGFVADARSRGAAAAVVRRVPVESALGPACRSSSSRTPRAALQRLAAFHRRRSPIPVVAVTGSNGKTTTKELCAAVLAARFRVLKAGGSFNNQWGRAAHAPRPRRDPRGRGPRAGHERLRGDRRARPARPARGGGGDDDRAGAPGRRRVDRGGPAGEGRAGPGDPRRRHRRAERRRPAGPRARRHARAPRHHVRPGAGGRRAARRGPAGAGRARLRAGDRRRAGGRAAAAERPPQRVERGRGGGGRPGARHAARRRRDRAGPGGAGEGPARLARGGRGPRPRRHVQRQPGVPAGRARRAAGRGRRRARRGSSSATCSSWAGHRGGPRRGRVLDRPAAVDRARRRGTASRADGRGGARAGCGDVAACQTRRMRPSTWPAACAPATWCW